MHGAQITADRLLLLVGVSQAFAGGLVLGLKLPQLGGGRILFLLCRPDACPVVGLNLVQGAGLALSIRVQCRQLLLDSKRCSSSALSFANMSA